MSVKSGGGVIHMLTHICESGAAKNYAASKPLCRDVLDEAEQLRECRLNPYLCPQLRNLFPQIHYNLSEAEDLIKFMDRKIAERTVTMSKIAIVMRDSKLKVAFDN